jgi:hypothetical protein
MQYTILSRTPLIDFRGFLYLGILSVHSTVKPVLRDHI